MKISIIVPVYNVQEYLPQCIESVINQTYDDFELILVDDGSTDASLQICNDYAIHDSRIKVLHQDNLGVSVARNNGISISTGQWVTFIDSDDWISKSFLDDFKCTEHIDSDMIIQGLSYIDHQTGKIIRQTRFENDQIYVPDKEGKLSKYDILSFGVTVCKCFKRSLIKAYSLSFDESISYHEDHIFTLSYLARSNTISTVSACGYFYRCSHNQQSLSKKKYSYEKLYAAATGMFHQLNLVSSHFKLSKEYYKHMASFCLSPKVSAVLILFEKPMGVNQRFCTMKKMLSPLKDISSYYYPRNYKYSIIRILAYDISGLCLYIFFSVIKKLKSK